MNTLPAELLDQVIAHAAQSTSDRTRGRHAANLSSCCLVSRRFREAAEPVLYSTIFLENLSNAPALLLKTLASRPHLAEIVKELFIECAAPCATPVQQVYQLRDFLEGALGLLVNLRSLGSNHRVVTTKLVEATLYKRGSGYSMSIPTELGNVRTLELFAADYIYKYNYILRLPQLRRVVLHSAKIIDYDIEDAAFPDDWGWTSSSIKELVLHQGYRHLSSMAMRLRARSLRALSSSMPCLEYIRLYHFECNLFPRQSRHLLAFFAPQLQSSLRQLIIQDGRIDARYPEIGPNYLTDDGMAALADIKTSRLEVLSIDVHILFDTIHNMSLVETINAASLPAALRHLHLRYVEANDMSSVGDTNTMLSWNCNDVAGQIKSKCPLLESINLELRLLKTPDNIAIERYKYALSCTGVQLDVQIHNCPTPRRTSIICSGRT